MTGMDAFERDWAPSMVPFLNSFPGIIPFEIQQPLPFLEAEDRSSPGGALRQADCCASLTSRNFGDWSGDF